MGDRGNIKWKDDGGSFYFYTHWTGHAIPHIIRAALISGRDRWDDPPYLARIMFCEMVRGQESETTGFGIATRPGEEQHPTYLIDCPNQAVVNTANGREWTFDEFISLEQ